MLNELVSIVVPAYNVGPYISECLDSLIYQTYINIEIICVDDGSTDNTYRILKAYQLKDERIKLYRQSKQNAGVARNLGIKVAKGKYLLFVDADDFCRLDMVETLVRKAESDHTDILVFDLQHYDNKSKKIIDDSWTSIRFEYFGGGVKTAMDLKDTIFQFTSSGPTNKLYLRKFIIANDIWFQSIPRTNDLFFVYVAMTYADRIAVLNERLQYYRINNPNSLQSTNEKSPLAFLKALQELKDNLVKRGVFDLYKKSYAKMSVAVSMYNLASQKNEDMYVLTANAIRHAIIVNQDIGLCESSCKVQVKKLMQTIQQNADVVIYGAGKLADVLVRYLLFIQRINKSRIKIIVTQKSDIEEDLCGIRVAELNEKIVGNRLSVYVIAVDDKRVQHEMTENLQLKGISNIIIIGFDEMANLVGAMWSDREESNEKNYCMGNGNVF